MSNKDDFKTTYDKRHGVYIVGYDNSTEEWNRILVDANGLQYSRIVGVTAAGDDEEILSAAKRLLVDGSGVTQPVSGTVGIARPSASSVAKVASSASSVTLKSANALRLGLSIFNDSAQALYVKFGTTASAADYTVKILAGGYFEALSPCYTGRVDGIWAGADGNAYVTELA